MSQKSKVQFANSRLLVDRTVPAPIEAASAAAAADNGGDAPKRRRRSSGPARGTPERSSSSGSKVQTSVSLPVSYWVTLTDVAGADTASVVLGRLLAAHTPDDTDTVISLLDAWLDDPPTDASEIRNVRLPNVVRVLLDRHVASLRSEFGLSAQEASRSNLIRAIVAAHSPADEAAARALIPAARRRGREDVQESDAG